jgi:uncharacterized protein YndB with AHSA1/START domain
MMAALPIVAALLLTTDAPVPPGKERTDRTISLEVTVDAPPAEVFRLWTTSEGATKFLAPAAHIEPNVGGRYQIVFDPVGDPEGAYHGSKVGKVLRIVPDKELSFEWPMPPFGPELGGPPVPTWVELEFLPAPDKTGRTRLRFAQYGFKTGGKWDAFDWSAPPTMPEVRKKRTNVQIQLTEKGPKEVAVHLVSLGWGTGDEWVAAHQYFDKAWTSVLGSLQKRFAEGPRVWTSQ